MQKRKHLWFTSLSFHPWLPIGFLGDLASLRLCVENGTELSLTKRTTRDPLACRYLDQPPPGNLN